MEYEIRIKNFNTTMTEKDRKYFDQIKYNKGFTNNAETLRHIIAYYKERNEIKQEKQHQKQQTETIKEEEKEEIQDLNFI